MEVRRISRDKLAPGSRSVFLAAMVVPRHGVQLSTSSGRRPLLLPGYSRAAGLMCESTPWQALHHRVNGLHVIAALRYVILPIWSAKGIVCDREQPGACRPSRRASKSLRSLVILRSVKSLPGLSATFDRLEDCAKVLTIGVCWWMTVGTTRCRLGLTNITQRPQATRVCCVIESAAPARSCDTGGPFSVCDHHDQSGFCVQRPALHSRTSSWFHRSRGRRRSCPSLRHLPAALLVATVRLAIQGPASCGPLIASVAIHRPRQTRP